MSLSLKHILILTHNQSHVMLKIPVHQVGASLIK